MVTIRKQLALADHKKSKKFRNVSYTPYLVKRSLNSTATIWNKADLVKNLNFKLSFINYLIMLYSTWLYNEDLLYSAISESVRYYNLLTQNI